MKAVLCCAKGMVEVPVPDDRPWPDIIIAGGRYFVREDENVYYETNLVLTVAYVVDL